jgi:hypothetical protein
MEAGSYQLPHVRNSTALHTYQRASAHLSDCATTVI